MSTRPWGGTHWADRHCHPPLQCDLQGGLPVARTMLGPVRNCWIKTTPWVEKKDLLGTRLQGHHSRIQSEVAWLNWVLGFIGGAKPWGRERVSGLLLSLITRWNKWTCLASWVTGSSWGFVSRETRKHRSLASSHKSGGLVLVLALGTSTHPKNARDLTGPNLAFLS
jgi:hypothetical protein